MRYINIQNVSLSGDLTSNIHICKDKIPCVNRNKSLLQKTFYHFLVATVPSYCKEMMNLLYSIPQTSHPEQTLLLKTTDNTWKNIQMIFLAALLTWQESRGSKQREQVTPRVTQSTKKHQMNWIRGRTALINRDKFMNRSSNQLLLGVFVPRR